MIGCRIRDETSIEVDASERISNGIQATVQGGAQALLAEIAAEHACATGGRMCASDLDIRFLSRLREGPLVATAARMDGRSSACGGQRRAQVRLTDGGHATSCSATSP